MPLSRYLRTAPHEWLLATLRRRAVLLNALQGIGCLQWGLLSYRFQPVICGSTSTSDIALHEEYTAIGAVWLFASIACLADRAPSWAVEAVACCCHITFSATVLWGTPATWSALIIRGGSLIFCGVRPIPFFATIAVDGLNAFLSHPFEHPCNVLDFAFGVISMLTMLTVSYFAMHTHWSQLFDAQRDLATEKTGLNKLLNMVCDAACWVEPDTGLIVRCDQRLDAMMGQEMAGQRVGKHMPADEHRRFAACIASTAKEVHDTPVELVRSRLEALDGHVFDVELFIADLRFACASDNVQGGLAGFLIGIRLAYLTEDSSDGHQDDEMWGDQTPNSRAEASGPRLSEENVARLDEDVSDSDSDSPAPPVRSLCARSLPETLRSAPLPDPQLHICSRPELEAAIAGDAALAAFPRVPCLELRDTLLRAVALMLDHAAGGALLCVADAKAFRHVFDSGAPGRPTAQTCDQGYMTDRLRGTHISESLFAAAFREFTQHSDNDRWPFDHADERARGRPKDGAFLLSTGGYRIKCAAKLLGLAPAATWANMGTKHAAALACAWEVPGCFVFIRSDGGARHVVVRRRGSLHVYAVQETA